MSKETINIGALPNDGDGDPMRVAFEKTNSNFTELYSTATIVSVITTTTDTPNQIIWQSPATFDFCDITIKTTDQDSPSNQYVKMAVSLANDKTSAQWMSYGNLSIGSPIATYNVSVSSGNVVLVTSPTAELTLEHKIAVSKIE